MILRGVDSGVKGWSYAEGGKALFSGEAGLMKTGCLECSVRSAKRIYPIWGSRSEYKQHQSSVHKVLLHIALFLSGHSWPTAPENGHYIDTAVGTDNCFLPYSSVSLRFQFTFKSRSNPVCSRGFVAHRTFLPEGTNSLQLPGTDSYRLCNCSRPHEGSYPKTHFTFTEPIHESLLHRTLPVQGTDSIQLPRVGSL